MEVETKEDVKSDEIVQSTKSFEMDLEKYKNNLKEEDDKTAEIKELLEAQDMTITQLRSEIKTLKELNMQLALKGSETAEPVDAVKSLNNVFNKV